MAREHLGGDSETFLEACRLIEDSRPQGRPFYYLSLLGTHTDYRGHGIGTELLKENLATVDAAHVPAYLESTNPRNIPRYERLGFRRIGSYTLPTEGPDIDLMWREPG